MTFQYVEILKEHGASANQVKLFKQLWEKELLQGKNSKAVFDLLSEKLVDVPWDKYNRFTVFKLVEYPDRRYYDRLHHLQMLSLDKEAREWDDMFPDLIDKIEAFCKNSNEITFLALYKALDFDDVFSCHHDPNDGYSAHYFEVLKSKVFDKQPLHIFALFICLTSDNPHIVQNALMTLWACPGTVPYELLDVLGRYEPYNLTSFDLISWVPSISGELREALSFTHFRSMDSAFYFRKLLVIENSDNTDMKYWAALNTISESAYLYFHDEVMEQTPNDDQILAALEHSIWSVIEQIDKTDIAKRMRVIERLRQSYHEYLDRNVRDISVSLIHAKWLARLYEKLNQSVSNYGNHSQNSEVLNRGLSLLDLMSQWLSEPKCDELLTELSSDLVRESDTYASLIRPARHRYSIYLEAKSRAYDIWFAREFERVKFGDISNWGSLSITLKTGKQFNELVKWLRSKTPHPFQQGEVHLLFGKPVSEFVSMCLDVFPDPAELYLDSQKFIEMILKSGQHLHTRKALFILKNNRRGGHQLAPSLMQTLEDMDATDMSNLDKRILAMLLKDTV